MTYLRVSGGYILGSKKGTGMEKMSNNCNCKHNHSSNSDEPCCRCDSRKTNTDRIRDMSDEELAEFLVGFKNTFGEEYEGKASCMEWLQSEAE